MRKTCRTLFGSRDFVYENDFRFHDRYDDEADYWTRHKELQDGRIDANVLHDLVNEPLAPAPPRYQLYDLADDPDERLNLALTQPGLAAAMGGTLRQHWEVLAREIVADPPAGIEPEQLERLRSLGYVH